MFLNISIIPSSEKPWVMSTPMTTLTRSCTADCQMLTDAAFIMEIPPASTARDHWLHEDCLSWSKRSNVGILFQELSFTGDKPSLRKTWVCVKMGLLSGITAQWRSQRDLSGLNASNRHVFGLCVIRLREHSWYQLLSWNPTISEKQERQAILNGGWGFVSLPWQYI